MTVLSVAQMPVLTTAEPQHGFVYNPSVRLRRAQAITVGMIQAEVAKQEADRKAQEAKAAAPAAAADSKDAAKGEKKKGEKKVKGGKKV